MVNKKCYSPVLKQKIPRIRFYWTVYFQTRKSKLITKTNLLKILTSKNTQNNRYSNINNIENFLVSKQTFIFSFLMFVKDFEATEKVYHLNSTNLG